MPIRMKAKRVDNKVNGPPAAWQNQRIGSQAKHVPAIQSLSAQGATLNGRFPRMTQMTAVERHTDSANPLSLCSIPMHAVPKVEVAPNGVVVLNLRH